MPFHLDISGQTLLPEDLNESVSVPTLRPVPRRGTEDLPPDRARIRFLASLGGGGMGLVYRAWDVDMQAQVAAKLVRWPSPDAAVQLKHEFRVARQVGHPNLVSLYDLFADDLGAFFTMELLRGEELIRFLRRGLPPGFALGSEGLLELRRVFADLVSGLRALHEAGIVHRDLKPANVLVTDEGRVVLLDFGVAAHRLERGPFGTQAVGTPAYMAPEQALGRDAGPAADAWALGCLLSEALTGQRARAPMWGTAALDPDANPAIRPFGPDDLADLVVALQSWPAGERPSLADVAKVLGHSSAPRLTMPAKTHAPFVDRDEARACLAGWLGGTGPTVVAATGPAGIGKSALIGATLAAFAGGPDRVVLSARCANTESVPFRAWDPVVDLLSERLLALPREEADGLVSPETPSLVKLFPVLARVPALAFGLDAPAPDDPVERRQAAFRGFGDLLERLGEQRRLVVAMDEAVWGDEDSAALLTDLAARSAPNLCLVVAHREGQAEGAPLIEAAREAGLRWGGLGTLHLPPLADADADALLAELLGEHLPADRSALLEQAEGSPFLLVELAHQLRGGSAVATVEQAIAARTAELDADARRLREAAAIADSPVTPGFLGELAALQEGVWEACYRLRDRRLLRSVRDARADRVEPYHERVQQAVVAGLSPARRVALHARAAHLLRGAGAPLRRVRHLVAAGESAEAARCAVDAGRDAQAALAFEQAVSFFRQATELVPSVEACEGLGVALRYTGRLAESAEALLRASELAAGDEQRASELRRAAGEAWLHAGDVAAGLRAMAPLLERAGIGIPGSVGAAQLTSLWYRVRFLIGGQPRVRTAPGALSGEEHRLDLLWSLSTALGMVDPARGDVLGVRHLLDAARIGEPVRLSRALGFEASCEAFAGSGWFLRRARELAARASALASETGNPADRAWALMAMCTVHGLAGEFAESAAVGREAEGAYLRECKGVDWELMIVRTYLNGSLALLGEVSELVARVPAGLEDAERRGHRLAAVVHRAGQPSVAWLWLDQPEVILDAEGPPATEGVPFSALEYFHLLGTTQARLYTGDATGARAALDAAWPGVKAGGFLTFPYCSTEMALLRARVAAACGDATACRAQAKAIAGATNLRHAPAFSALALALSGGSTAAAAPGYRAAAAACTAAGLRLYAAACAWRAELCEGNTAAATTQVALARGLGVVAPERYFGSVVPVPA
ncbi:hypothetical protein LBMAG42_27740 [Deltaproteobacteria bacterium]|nr:hypothetical protein LBMAG42_27740 [Deltaproteobacteria bacterium]